MWKHLFTSDATPPSDPGARAVRAAAPDAASGDADRNDTALVSTWRLPIRRRLCVVAALIVVWAVGIESRLFYMQVYASAFYKEKALRQQQRKIDLPGRRGPIVDRNGRLLAYSVEAFDISADPTAIEDDAGTARAVCDALGNCTASERADLARKFAAEAAWTRVRYARDVSPEQANRVAALKLDGVGLVPVTLRYYPQFQLASQLLGFVGIDNQGQAGVEAKYDPQIRGRAGQAVAYYSKEGRLKTLPEREPTSGAGIELTIDVNYQHIVERELRVAVEEHRALSGTVVVMDPSTGEVLANASYPTFNPNDPGSSPDAFRKNRAIQEIYEPGSTFKIVTAAAALEGGLFSPSDLIDVSQGYIKLPGRAAIWDDHPSRELTFEDVIVKSSNVGAIKIGWRVGADLMSRWIRRFGFGQQLVPDFPGQSAGIVHGPEALNQSALASVSMGYQVSVTPLQMALAVSAVANGGSLMEPHLVRAITRDGVREEIAPRVLKQVMKPETAATLTTILEGVAQRGTARAAALARYQVAGKTGTSKKAIPGGYSATDRTGSFVGFVPSRDPRFTILVLIDTPRAGQVYGGAVAAPAFKRIAEALLREAGVPPTVNPEPPLMRRASAEPPSRRVEAVRVSARPNDERAMPDVRGLSARDAARVLSRLGLGVRLSGDGVVRTQQPEAGASLVGIDVGVLFLSRAGPAVSPGGGRP